MAEIQYKRITEFDAATVPFDGANETIPVVQSGTTKRALWSGIFGSGWWAVLKAAFSSFVAPEALHATDADTLGGDTSASYRDASNLTAGALPLDRIPAELTGKNAATATLAATATNALACSGNAATATNSLKLGGLDANNFLSSSIEPRTFINIATTLDYTGKEWIIPKGIFYIFPFCSDTSLSRVSFQVKDSSGVWRKMAYWGAGGGSTPAYGQYRSGIFVSDGINARFYMDYYSSGWAVPIDTIQIGF